jgi:hypothetical protein
MTADEVIGRLAAMEKRLASLADQAHETWQQARHTLERIELVRSSLEQLKLDVLSTSDTVVLRRSALE